MLRARAMSERGAAPERQAVLDGNRRTLLVQLLQQVLHRAHPVVVGIVGAEESLVFPGHGPEKVGVVSRRAHRRMIAFRKLHQIVLFDGIGLIDLPVFGIHPLDGESLLRLSVGLEDPDDIIADLKAGLDKIEEEKQ